MRKHNHPKNKKTNLLNTNEQETIETEISENVDDEQIIICYEPTDSLKEYFKPDATPVPWREPHQNFWKRKNQLK